MASIPKKELDLCITPMVGSVCMIQPPDSYEQARYLSGITATGMSRPKPRAGHHMKLITCMVQPVELNRGIN